MARRKLFAVIDTETLGAVNKLVYDLAIAITDKKGNIVSSRRWLNANVLYKGNPQLTQKGMYFYSKLGLYRQMWKDNPYCRKEWLLIIQEVNDYLEEYGIDVICAYNLPFDLTALAFTTIKHAGGRSDFFRRKYQVIDLWTVACQTICKQKTYQRQAQEHGWTSPAGNVKTSAEVVYRYIMQDFDFIEDHTALEDCIVEVKILSHVLRQHKSITKGRAISHPWRLAQPVKAGE